MYKILDKVNTPSDIKKLNITQMNLLADDIRQLLVKSVSECGGHLAPNLGVVELTIALHYVFNTPEDKIIWDVGHQSYVHKILTGRKEKMSSLRQYGGLSGFPKFEESIHDCFNTGHSSTSVSAAVGMALARDIQRKKHSIIAVLGDGAFTGGMVYEALNHAGHEAKDLIVILNDNEMSISKNVGAMSGYLNRLRTDPSYARTKEEIESVLNRIPAIGQNIAKAAGRFKDTVKYLMVPGVLFEELGFSYIGPINGHNLDELCNVFLNAKKMKGPILIHAMTQKGKGYGPALKNPDIFHGVGPFDIQTGSQVNKSIKTYTEVFGEYIANKADHNKDIVAITAAMTSGTGLKEFAQKHPERFFDVGICEQHAVTMAAGLARSGLKPVVSIYSTFLQRSYDQIMHDVALQNLPVIFAIDRAGLVGEDGATHHGVFDLSYLTHIPNMTIMAPSNENELVKMFNSAFELDGPVAIRYPRGAGEGVDFEPTTNEAVEFGKSKTISQGKDLAIIAVGRGVNLGKEVCRLLKEKNIKAELVDARFVKPLDEEKILQLAIEYPHIVTIEENSIIGGFGSRVLDLLAREKINSDVLTIGVPDDFTEHGNLKVLLQYLNMDPESITEKILYRWNKLLKNDAWELLKFGKN
ncbi:1-deoxy-D-xylulose 5-phosphate synthase [Candidatus Syntrophocurvum alkaliphilum]|uniref:1-deoxy-D-xylulose-5-phosphate synthase n=1 Tax=Candidatus Syntrophocurvum alkaliphilum TaxID=2293317 RepID=A0A6I6DH62_9FIRM|nr:1-deoxy-D-xylulose-5-phosphate synthase [Candidatus Syntrophocurvum alkaliphilum]QGT98969.1 1-deoxy-D-xylulose 5-phosphate synthase [Candidatus Syntrophocurvum alkaliphilum]